MLKYLIPTPPSWSFLFPLGCSTYELNFTDIKNEKQHFSFNHWGETNEKKELFVEFDATIPNINLFLLANGVPKTIVCERKIMKDGKVITLCTNEFTDFSTFSYKFERNDKNDSFTTVHFAFSAKTNEMRNVKI